MQELGEELHVTKPRVTALVSELLEKDFVVQSTDEKDKRKKYLSLSEKESNVLNHIEKPMKSGLNLSGINLM